MDLADLMDVSLPAEAPQWVCWKRVRRNGRDTKIPVDPKTGRGAAVDKPATWHTLDVAVRAVERFGLSGVGFVFTKQDPFAGVDLDNCRDPQTGEIAEWAVVIIRALDSYTEISPSGTGVKIFVKASISGTGRRRKYQTGAVEMYSSARYFTVTGRHVEGTPTAVEYRQMELASVHATIFGASNETGKLAPQPNGRTVTQLDDEALLERARNARNGHKFERLWTGDCAGDYLSESESDLALCSILAFWTGGDRARIDRLFRRSGLMREKWERKDYREKTIDRACNQEAETWATPSLRRSGIGFTTPQKQPADTINILELPPRTEYGNAERLVLQHGQDIRYCQITNKWLIWTGTRWEEDSKGAVMRLAKDVVRGISAEAAEVLRQAADLQQALSRPNLPEGERATLEKRVNYAGELARELSVWGKKSQRFAQTVAMVNVAGTEPGMPVTPDDFDTDNFLLNVKNGTLNLRTGQLQLHQREDLITKICPVDYDPAAKCPRWNKFLGEIFEPHPDLIPFVQMAAGYSLTGDTREECLFLLLGTGRNGKGTFIKTLAAVMGDYSGTADFSTFVLRRDDSAPRDDIANMRGRRFIAAQESREGAPLAESVIKTLTGGDRVRARRLYENSAEFDPTYKIWLVTNHKPLIRGTDPAIWSRPKLIPFDVSFDGREDRGLKAALMDELPGILVWLVEGCLRWQVDGLKFPATVVDTTREYRTESDQVTRFLEEMCVTGSNFTVKGRDLYTAYRGWADGVGEDALSETSFGNRLRERGLNKKHTNSGNLYQGIRLGKLGDGLSGGDR